MPSDRWNREKTVMDQLKKAPHVIEGHELIQIGIDLDRLSEEQLSDIEGWITYGNKNEIRVGSIASTIMHDLLGLREPEDNGFIPRTASYAKYKENAHEGISS